MHKSDLKDYPEYFHKYVCQVEEEDLIPALENSLRKIRDFFTGLPEEKWDYRYQPEKWSIREVLVHLIDSERIMGYRALRFARNDPTELAGYDHELYVRNSNASQRSMTELLQDYSIARKANLELFRSFDATMLGRRGVANKREVSVLLIGFVIAGHGLHHLQVIQQRYL